MSSRPANVDSSSPPRGRDRASRADLPSLDTRAAEPRRGLGPSLFRKQALDRLSSPEQLDQLLETGRTHDVGALCAVLLVMAGALLWAAYGSLPIEASGRGTLQWRDFATEPSSGRSARPAELVALLRVRRRPGLAIEPGMEARVVPARSPSLVFPGTVRRVGPARGVPSAGGAPPLPSGPSYFEVEVTLRGRLPSPDRFPPGTPVNAVVRVGSLRPMDLLRASPAGGPPP